MLGERFLMWAWNLAGLLLLISGIVSGNLNNVIFAVAAIVAYWLGRTYRNE